MDQKLVEECNKGLAQNAKRDVTALRAQGGGLLLSGVKRPKRM
jgi:hypothetical protein